MNYLISNPDNIFYITGYNPRSRDERECFVLAVADSISNLRNKESEIYIFSYKMLASQIKASVRNNVKFIEISRENPLSEHLGKIIRDKRLICEGNDLSLAEFTGLEEKLKEKDIELYSQNLSEELLKLREIKTDSELKLIKKAVQISENAFRTWKDRLKIGEVTELEAAWQLKLELVEAGADDIAFEPIIALNENAAYPHHTPTSKKINSGHILLVDWGAEVSGYKADMTRTFIVGGGEGEEVSQEFESDIKLVESAYNNAISDISKGKSLKTIYDNLDDTLAEKEELMIHSLGHGIGIAAHEYPRLGPESEERLPANSVVTIEPGIYLPEKYGIRLEKTVLVTKSGVDELGELPLLI